MSRHLTLLAAVLSLLLAGTLAGCSGSRKARPETPETHRLPDTLRVGTLYSPTSYFLYRDQEMGYDYNLVTQMAQDKGMAVALTVAPSLPRLLELLDSGIIDLAAYEIPVTAEFRQSVLACGPEYVNTQVLVQPLVDGKPAITD